VNRIVFQIPWLIYVLPLALAAVFWLAFSYRAKRFGYRSTGAYLRAAPRSDPEKRDAVDLTLKGLVWFVLSGFFVFLFGPFLLFAALIPLFYGARKLAYAWMGLGLVDDADQTEA
jgi:hypothetical protein